jgi:hypothetical protein
VYCLYDGRSFTHVNAAGMFGSGSGSLPHELPPRGLSLEMMRSSAERLLIVQEGMDGDVSTFPASECECPPALGTFIHKGEVEHSLVSEIDASWVVRNASGLARPST